MPLTISDEVLQQAGLTANEALVEFACRLFEAGKLTLPSASRLAGLGRIEFERELYDRNIPAYRLTLEDLKQDLAALDRLGI
jgi:predicted HTH domain antitoxin